MKKFLIKISYTVLPLWLLFVGSVFYVSLFVSPRASGDLGALACIPFGYEYDELIAAQAPNDTLFMTVNSEEELQTLDVDVLSIGDSFSQQVSGSYQNYLALSGLSVANCSWMLFSSPLQYAYNLLEQGILDSTRVRVLVVETGERLFETEVYKFSPGRPNIPKSSGSSSQKGEEGKAKNANEWSLSRARDMLLHRLGMNSAVYSAQLSRELFSSDEPSTLYFYHEDISNGMSLSPAVEGKAKAVQATLREKAAERGVRFMWVVATDKYDLYQDYIVDNTFRRKTVMEDISRMLGDSRDLLLTKDVLLPLVESGEKDVYLFNDSHWSYKGTKAVAQELYERIEKDCSRPQN